MDYKLVEILCVILYIVHIYIICINIVYNTIYSTITIVFSIFNDRVTKNVDSCDLSFRMWVDMKEVARRNSFRTGVAVDLC